MIWVYACRYDITTVNVITKAPLPMEGAALFHGSILNQIKRTNQPELWDSLLYAS